MALALTVGPKLMDESWSETEPGVSPVGLPPPTVMPEPGAAVFGPAYSGRGWRSVDTPVTGEYNTEDEVGVTT